MPKPRFAGVAAFLEEDGYIITHGGYCGQDRDTIGTIDVLDLAPCYRKSPFDRLAIDQRRVSYEEITNAQALRGQQDHEAAFQQMMQSLMNTPENEHHAVAGNMLIMRMIANGQLNYEHW